MGTMLRISSARTRNQRLPDLKAVQAVSRQPERTCGARLCRISCIGNNYIFSELFSTNNWAYGLISPSLSSTHQKEIRLTCSESTLHKTNVMLLKDGQLVELMRH